MAEETPNSLSSSGFFGGQAANNRGSRADRSADRMTAAAERLADVLSRAAQNFSAGRATASGGSSFGPTHRAPNGGGATFGGQPAPSGGAHREGGGAHRATMPQRAGTMYQQAGGMNGVAKSVGKLGVGGIAAYTAMNAPDEVVMQSLAAQYSPYGDVTRTARAMFGGNTTATSAKDLQQYQLMMRTTSGFTPGSADYARSRGVVERMSLIDPTISNTAGMAAATSLGSVSSFNKLQGLGITPTDSKGQADPMSVARQILTRMGSSKVKTIEQVDAAFGPSGSATITIEGYIANGYLSSEAAGPVRAAMRSILVAQVRGMSYTSLRRNVDTLRSNPNNEAGDAARAALKPLGIGNSLIAGEREREGLRRESQLETLGGFSKGMELGQETMKEFRDIFNKALGATASPLGFGPSYGDLLGLTSGGGAGGFGGMYGTVMGSVRGIIPGIGDGPRNMSAGAASYGGAARAGAGSGGRFAGAVGSPLVRGSTGSATRSGEYSLGSVKPWVSSAASILGPKFGIKTIGGYRSTSSTPGSDHPKGLALDFMCSKSQGDGLAPFAVANHKALNITYVIWRQRIWSINSPSWKQMEDRGSPTANHMDHVHISFLASPNNANVGGMDLGSGGDTASASNSLGLGSSATAMDNGSSAAFTASTPNASLGSNIGYSELAALALGGIGGGLGMTGASAGSSASSSSGSGSGAPMGGIGGSVSSQAGGSVRTGTYNLFRKSSNKDSQDDLQRLMGMADVLSLTEYIGKKRELGAWLRGKGWGVYSSGGSDDTAIAWDQSDYELVSSGSRMLSDSGGKGAFRDRKAAYARLRSKATGAEFYQISGHTVGHAQRGNSGWEAKMREQFAGIKGLVGDLSDSNIPIFLAGDFNVNSKRTGIKPDFGLEHLAGVGLDRIYGSGVSGSSGTKRVGGLSSDHDAILATLQMAGIGVGGGGTAGIRGGTPAQNQALGKAMAAKMGWGSQWDSLLSLWSHESGWRTNADNPSSSAYGIPQALASLHNLPKGYYDRSTGSGSSWQGYGGDPRVQIGWGLNYIKGRYGGPDAAWDFWRKNNWYDKGSWDIPQDQDARVHRKEMLLPATIAEAVRNEFNAPSRNSQGSAQIVFEKESIVIKINGSMGSSEARAAATEFVDAVHQDRRIRMLAEGRA